MALLTRIAATALLLWGLEAAPAAAQEDKGVGQVADLKATVKGRRGNAPQSELKKRDPVFEKMEVQSFARAGARILINTDLPERKGVILLGPKTQLELSERSLTTAKRLKKMSWLLKLGQFRLALRPRDPNELPEEGECFVYTPAGDLVQLAGTDVAVKLERDGTLTVWAIEGEVTVKAADGGNPVPVPAGYRTRVRPGREPEVPVPFGPDDGPGLGPDSSPPPGETIFPDPPNLRAIRLDLPG